MGATETLTTAQAATIGGIIGAVFGVVMMVAIIIMVIQIIACWKIFTKAGEKGWKALIPIYNQYILYKIVDMKEYFWGMLCLSFICSIIFTVNGFNPNTMTEEQLQAYDMAAHPMVIVASLVLIISSIIVAIINSNRTSKVFGHGKGFAVGLFFLRDIFLLILAFGNSKYDKKKLDKE